VLGDSELELASAHPATTVTARVLEALRRDEGAGMDGEGLKNQRVAPLFFKRLLLQAGCGAWPRVIT
jgi:hypothetical protein